MNTAQIVFPEGIPETVDKNKLPDNFFEELSKEEEKTIREALRAMEEIHLFFDPESDPREQDRKS